MDGREFKSVTISNSWNDNEIEAQLNKSSVPDYMDIITTVKLPTKTILIFSYKHQDLGNAMKYVNDNLESMLNQLEHVEFTDDLNG